MYSVSEKYIEKILSTSVKKRRISGTLDDIPFTEDDILAASFKYSDIAVSGSDIKLGGVFVGQLNLTFLSSFVAKIKRGTWRGKVINARIGLRLEDGTWEDIPLKPYTIDDASYSALGIDITAYDNMAKFDRNFGVDTSSGTIYDFALLACEACGVEFGMTQAETNALPNGAEVLGLYANSDIDTYRDLISWVAVTVGGFATINREGKLIFKTWNSEPVIEIDKFNRFAGGTWSDFETYYTGISIVNMETEQTQYYGLAEDTGLTMNLGSNPLMQYGTDEVKSRQRYAVLDALQNFKYVPFKSTSLIDPCLDLGDVIAYVGGLADEQSLCCVMRMDFQYSSGMTLQGYGKNPALFGAQSKTDKNISGLLNKTSENEVITHTFTNASTFTLGEDVETQVLRLRFATVSPNTVTILHEIDLNTEATSEDGIITCTVKYYLNGELLSYTPITTWNNDGMHLLPLMYFLNTLSSGERYDWIVTLTMSGGTATIGRENIHAVLQGQGLVAVEKWDGLLEVEDEYTPVVLHGKLTLPYSDGDVAIGFITPISAGDMSDNYAVALKGKLVLSYNDEVNIVMKAPIFTIVSESDEEEVLITEEDDFSILITEGGEVDGE